MHRGSIFKWFLKSSAFIGVKSHWLHLFGFSPLWAFKCSLKLPAWINTKSHWLHLFGFSPLWALKCGLKLPAWINTKSHWLHLFDLSPLCAFKMCLIKSHAWIHISCICFFSTMCFKMCPHRENTLTSKGRGWMSWPTIKWVFWVDSIAVSLFTWIMRPQCCLSCSRCLP